MPAKRITSLVFVASFVLLAAGTALAHEPFVTAGLEPGTALAPADTIWWVKDTIDAANDRGSHASLAIDPETAATFISYYDATSGDLRLAKSVDPGAGNCGPGNSWQCWTASGESNAGQHNAVAICDGSGYGGISYHDATARSLVYAQFKTESNPDWQFTTVVPTASGRTSGLYTSLRFDGDCQPHIAYHTSQELPVVHRLNYARRHNEGGGNCGGGDWSCEVIDSGFGVGPFASMDLNSDGYPYFAYYDLGSGDLMHARPVYSGGNCGGDHWQCDAIQPVSGAGQVVGEGPHTAIVIREPHEGIEEYIAFYDALADTVNYATTDFSGAGNCGPGNSWKCIAIDTVGSSSGPMGVSLNVGEAGPAIAYHDANGDGLGGKPVFKVALPVSKGGNCGPGNTWKCETVDDGVRGSLTHNVGQYATVALQANGWPQAAYYDAKARDLLFAHLESDDDDPPTNPTTFWGSHEPQVWDNDDTILAHWTGASDGSGSGVNGYDIAWTEDANTHLDPPSVKTYASSTTSNPLPDGQNWYFHIRTKDQMDNWAAQTAHYGPFYIETAPPSNPTSFTSTPVAGAWSNNPSVTVAWSGAADSGSGVYGYSIEWSQENGTVPNKTVDTETTTTQKDLAEGAGWYLHVRACDVAGTWASGAAHFGPFQIDTTPPGSPTACGSTTHTVGEWSSVKEVQVGWLGANDGSGSGVYGYSLAWASYPTKPNKNVDTTGTTTIKELDDGIWRLSIRSRDVAGNWSNDYYTCGPYQIDATPPELTGFPSSPSHAPLNWSTDCTVDMEWDAATDSGGSGLAGYSYVWGDEYASPDSTVDTADTHMTSHCLADGDNWWFLVKACDEAGNCGGARGKGRYLIDTAPPGKPSILATGIDPAPESWTRDCTLEVHWTKPTDAGGSDLGGFSIEWSQDPLTVPKCDTNLGPDDLMEVSSCAKTDNGKWYFHVRAVDRAGGCSDTAHSQAWWVDRLPPESQASSFSPTRSRDFAVGCDGTDHGQSGVDTCEVMYWDVTDSTGWQPWWTFTSVPDAEIFHGLDGHTYQFQSRATDAVGNVESWPYDPDSETVVNSLDLGATGLEVTQAIQNLDNAVPLVAGKRTYVRFHVASLKWSADRPLMAELDVYDHDGAFLETIHPANQGRATVERLPSRANIDHGFLFWIPSHYTQGTKSFTARVNPDHALAEFDYSNNDWSAQVTFHPTLPICLVIVPVLPSLSWSGPVYTVYEPGFWEIVGLFQRFYPEADGHVLIYHSPAPVLPFLGRWDFSTAWDFGPVLDALQNLENETGWPKECGAFSTHFVGAVHPAMTNMRGGAGLGRRPGRVSAVLMEGGRDPVPVNTSTMFPMPVGGWVMAHEVGHNYGRKHVFCRGDEANIDPGYPYPGTNPCLIGPVDESAYYGIHAPIGVSEPIVIPPDGFGSAGMGDLMSYGGHKWISEYTYYSLYRARFGPVTKATVALPDDWLEAGEYLYASGLISPTIGTARLTHCHRTDEPNPDLLRESYARELEASTDYSLVLENAGGSVLYTHVFTPSVSEFEGDNTVSLGFGEIFPYDPDTARIVLLHQGDELAARTVSAHPPQVTILTPAGGESFEQPPTISWQASDADGNALHYVVQYSIDGGTTWYALATDWTDEAFTPPTWAQMGGGDSVRVRVIANDGVNTGRAISAPFSLRRLPPTAKIVDPHSGTVYQPHQSIFLNGASLDAEDGTVMEETSYAWSCDTAGALGVGRLLTIPPLPTGDHRITLVVTDSDGMTGSDEILIHISPSGDEVRLFLPVLWK